MSEKLHKWDMYCLLMNNAVGAGILAIPGAFQQAGVLVTCSILSFLALVNWLLHNELLAVTEKLTLAQVDEPVKALLSSDQHLLASPHQWDLPEVVRILLGPGHRVVYSVCFVAYLIGVITAYTNIFGTAYGAFLDCNYTKKEVSEECQQTYLIGIAIFGVIVTVLTALDYKEQAWLQYIMTTLQFVLASIILTYTLTHGSTDHLTLANTVASNPSAIAGTFTKLVYALSYLTAVPSVFAASHKHHRGQRQVATWVNLSTLCLYCVFGSVCAIFLPDIPSNISLFFKELNTGGSILTKVAVLLVLVAPAVDIITNAPIDGHTLAGGVTTTIYGTDHEQTRQDNPVLYRVIRVLCVLPPFFLASLSTDLSTFVTISGKFSVVLSLVYIPICYNAALSKLPIRSKFEFKLRYLREVNTLIAVVFACVFVCLLTHDLWKFLSPS